jgi:hypothetical protein
MNDDTNEFLNDVKQRLAELSDSLETDKPRPELKDDIEGTQWHLEQLMRDIRDHQHQFREKGGNSG